MPLSEKFNKHNIFLKELDLLNSLCGRRMGKVYSKRIDHLSLPPLLYAEAAIPQHLRGPHFGSASWPLPFEAGLLPSTHRKVKGKGKFKARLGSTPRAEAYPKKRLSLPNPFTLTLASQNLRLIGAARLEKPLL